MLKPNPSVSMKMIEISSVNANDYKGLIEFLANSENENSEPEFWARRLNFWWDHNPAFSSGIERGWMLKEGHRIVGFLGIIPTEFQLSWERILVFNSTTWRVLPEYRNKSLNLLFKQVKLAKNSILFNTTPNKVVASILESLAFKKIPETPEKRYVLLTNTRRVLKNKISKRPLYSPLIGILTAVLKCYQFSRLGFRNTDKISEVRILNKADNEFDRLWDETKNLYGNTNIRTSKIVNWYCFGNLDFEKVLFGYFEKEKLAAYAIFLAEKDGGLKTLDCADLWGRKINGKVIRSFLFASKRFALDNDIDIVSFSIFGDSLNRHFKKIGLFRLSSWEQYFIKANTDKLEMINKLKSYFSKFQGDFGL
jgi:hypothetical protein